MSMKSPTWSHERTVTAIIRYGQLPHYQGTKISHSSICESKSNPEMVMTQKKRLALLFCWYSLLPCQHHNMTYLMGENVARLGHHWFSRMSKGAQNIDKIKCVERWFRVRRYPEDNSQNGPLWSACFPFVGLSDNATDKCIILSAHCNCLNAKNDLHNFLIGSLSCCPHLMTNCPRHFSLFSKQDDSTLCSPKDWAFWTIIACMSVKGNGKKGSIKLC